MTHTLKSNMEILRQKIDAILKPCLLTKYINSSTNLIRLLELEI